MVCGNSRKDITCELTGICTLVYVNQDFTDEGPFHFADQARYATSILSKYLDTVTVKTSKKFYKTNFPYDMIFIKDDVSTSDEQVEKLTRELNIHYRACIG